MARAATATTKKTTSAKGATGSGASRKSSTLSEREHAERAYYSWLDRGAPIGDDQYDWFRVEGKA